MNSWITLNLERKPFGWSDGGNTGLVLALKYPDKVKKMAVMATVLFKEAGHQGKAHRNSI